MPDWNAAMKTWQVRQTELLAEQFVRAKLAQIRPRAPHSTEIMEWLIEFSGVVGKQLDTAMQLLNEAAALRLPNTMIAGPKGPQSENLQATELQPGVGSPDPKERR